MTRFADWIVGHHINDEILPRFRVRIRKLMRLSWLKDKRIPRFYWSRPILMPDHSFSRNHMIKLPLRAVRMVRIRALTRWDAADLHVKWVPLPQVRRLRLSSQRLRNLLSRADEFPLWRGPRELLHIISIDLSHNYPLRIVRITTIFQPAHN